MINLPRVCDFHVHLRQDLRTMILTISALKGYTSTILAMLNVGSPHIQTIAQLDEYAKLIEKACMYTGMSPKFEVYLCPKIYQDWANPTTPEFIRQCAEWRFEGKYVKRVLAFKAYPSGGTTNSDGAITDFHSAHFSEIMSALSEHGLVLSIHSEMMGVDPFPAEAIFFEKVAPSLVVYAQRPKMVFEHLSTAKGVQFVRKSPENVMGTITPQHLIFTYDMVKDSNGRIVDPHKLCMPIAKTDEDRKELLAAVHHENFFYGSDTAPHPLESKLGDKPKCGVFSAYLMPYVFGHLLDCYREEYACAEEVEMFLCRRGRWFYGLPPSAPKRRLRIIPHTGAPSDSVLECDELQVGLPNLQGFDFKAVLEEEI